MLYAAVILITVMRLHAQQKLNPVRGHLIRLLTIGPYCCGCLINNCYITCQERCCYVYIVVYMMDHAEDMYCVTRSRGGSRSYTYTLHRDRTI